MSHLCYPRIKDKHYRLNRLLKISQTKGLCEDCGKKGKHIHHLDNNPDNNDIKNFKFLCEKCHYKTQYHHIRLAIPENSLRRKFIPYYQTIINLNEEEETRLQALIAKKWSIAEIFRIGISQVETMLKKAKDLIPTQK